MEYGALHETEGACAKESPCLRYPYPGEGRDPSSCAKPRGRTRPLRAGPARPGSPPDRAEAATRAGLLRPAPGDALDRRAAVRRALGTTRPAGPGLAAEVDAVPPDALCPRPPRRAGGPPGGKRGRRAGGPEFLGGPQPDGP